MATETLPWKQLLLNAIESDSHLNRSSFFQLATVGSTGRPSNRTLVYRGFEENSYRIQINTDSIEELKHCPFAERAWFATSFKSRLQYLGHDPGRPCLTEQSLEESHLDNSSGPLAAYRLLIMDPEKVDYYNLKNSQSIMFTSNQSVNREEKCWTS